MLPSLLCLLMGMSSKHMGGGRAAEVGLGSGSTVPSPESIWRSCRTCKKRMLPGQPSCYQSTQLQGTVYVLVQSDMEADQVVKVCWRRVGRWNVHAGATRACA